MRKSRAYILVWLMICIQQLFAQGYESRQLEYMHGLLAATGRLPASTGTFECRQATSLPLKVEYNAKGQISHLGVDLFSEEAKNALGRTICNFQERLFLELLLQKSNGKIRQQLAEYKIKTHLNEAVSSSLFQSLETILQVVRTEATEYILIKDSLTWSSLWRNTSDLFSLTFPADYTLISGMDKKEAEDLFEEQLAGYVCRLSHPLPFVINLDEFRETASGMYVKPGKEFFLKNVNSNVYVRKDGESYSLVFDRNYPEESISNLFCHLDRNAAGIQIRMNHRAYGSQVKSYGISLYDFLCYLGDGFETYTGIEKISEGEAMFTVIFKSKQFNFHHLLYIESPLETIFRKEGSMKGTLYTYIPSANVKNLYKEVVPNRRIIAELNTEE